jgi:ABC-2 type transport system permease protein
MNRRLLSVIRKEFTHIVRDPLTLGMMVALPILMLVMYGYAASFDVKEIPFAVLDNDHTEISREFVRRFDATDYFQFDAYLPSERSFADRMDSGRNRVIINIPKDFARNIEQNRLAPVQVLVDGSDPTWANSSIGYVNTIIQTYYQDRVAALAAKYGMADKFRQPIAIEPRIWYNETMKSVNFYIPGLIAVIMMQISATLTGLAIVNEKEQGTMEGLVVSPVRKFELMLGKVIPYVVIAFGDVILVTIVGYLLFGVPIKGNYLLLMFSTLVFLLGAMGSGIMISTIAHTGQEAMQMSTLMTMLPSILLSGFIYPIDNMPLLLQGISVFVPARFYIEIMRAIYLKGVGLIYFWPPFLALAALSAFNLVTAMRNFQKRID